jgi:hypothetical protein
MRNIPYEKNSLHTKDITFQDYRTKKNEDRYNKILYPQYDRQAGIDIRRNI